MNEREKKPYIIIGAGGHAAVIADILFKCGCSVKGFLDDAVAVGTEVLGEKVIGLSESCRDHPDCLFIIGVGNNNTRMRIAQTYSLDYGVAIHPSAVIGQQVEIGLGTVVMAGCVINPKTVIGEHCIINTGAVLDHDNRIHDFSHISPMAAIGGTVSIGCRTHVGIGACVKNNIIITDDVIVGAGAAVVNDIAEPGTYVGVPVRKLF